MRAPLERFNTLVLGAGQAGLAAAHALAARGESFAVLDAHARVGDSWRARWDSLRLFTPVFANHLPGLKFPGKAAHLAGKDEVGDYLQRYAEHFQLPIRQRTLVEGVCSASGGYVVKTEHATLHADKVVVATGAFRTPRRPDLARQLDSGIEQLHTNEYINPAQVSGDRVLVVGAANSGAQIALELAEAGRTVTLAGPDTGRIPRRLLGVDVYRFLQPLLRRRVSSGLGRRVVAKTGAGGDPLVGMRRADIAAAGVTFCGRVTAARGGLPVIQDKPRPFDAVVWATGYRNDYSWIEGLPCDAAGLPRHAEGLVPELPGLAFMGLRFMRTVGSSLLGGVGRDAQAVVGQLSAPARPRLRALRPARST